MDFKYRQIFASDAITCRVVTTLEFLKEACKRHERDTKKVYLIRYLRWRGYLATFPMYAFLLSVCRLTRWRVLFVCHNLIEHKFPSANYSRLLRGFVCWMADRVIVMHEDVKERIPHFQGKTDVSCFGEFRSYFLEDHPRNDEFSQSYESWLTANQISAPDVMFVGRYTPYKNVGKLLRFLERNEDVRGLIISEGMPLQTSATNVLLFDRAVVRELHHIHEQNGLVGVISIENCSVATAAYVYASYRVPVIVEDGSPVAAMVKQYGMGEAYCTEEEMLIALRKVQGRYSEYQQGCDRFLDVHNWEKAREIHHRVLDGI